MADVLPALIRTGAVALGSAVAGIGYASIVERNAFVLREVTMPVLTPGSTPLRVLHLSDLHMPPNQRRKQAWLRELASWEPDLVVNTGDNLAHPKAVPAVVQTLGDLLSRPGVFVFGSNDYFGPRLKNPANYLTNPGHRVRGEPLPWQDLRAAFTERGWLDLTHTRREFEVAGLHIAAAGVDDPHIDRDRYDTIAGPASPAANLRLGLTHSPEPRVLDRFAADGYQLVMAGHTHGGQLCLPFYGALVTNCGLDRSRAKGPSRWGANMRLHVSAGIGTSPFAPVRFCCRPEATLLTLIATPMGGRDSSQQPEPFAANSFGALTDRTQIAVRSLPRSWTDNAIRLIEADARRSADTHLLRYPLPSAWSRRDVEVALYLKDETTHITGSLKHRLARSLFLYALCNGWIGEGTTVVEASSGSTAVSEAYFAALLGLPFVAVMPAATSAAKVALIESHGGRCHFVQKSSEVYAEAERRRAGDRRALPGPVHQCRAGHRLARQQQHRRVDLRADARREAPDPGMDRGGRGHRRNQRDDRPLHPLPAARDPVVRRRPGELRVLSRLHRRSVRHRDAHVVAHRGHRPATRRAVVSARRGGPHGLGARRGVDRRRPSRQRRSGAPGGAVDGHQPVGRLRPARRDGRRGPQRFGGHLARRQRRPLRRHLFQRRLGRPRRDSIRPGPPQALVEFERSCHWN